MTDVQAACWGGLYVQSGNVFQWLASSNPSASAITGPTNVTSLAEGGCYPWAAAVTSGGNLWTWGNNYQGQLCDGQTARLEAPALVETGVASVSGGGEHLEFLTKGGKVGGCGLNQYGQLGNGTDTSATTPVAASVSNITAISAGNVFTLALDASGTVWSWGWNQFGQLGDGNTINADTPQKVKLPGPAVEIYAGGSGIGKTQGTGNGSGIALLANGQVWAWGDDAQGQLGPEIAPIQAVSTPIEVTHLPADVVQVAMGGADSFALTGSGALYGWGDNSLNQMDGQAATTIRVPTLIDPEVVQQVSATAGEVAVTV